MLALSEEPHGISNHSVVKKNVLPSLSEREVWQYETSGWLAKATKYSYHHHLSLEQGRNSIRILRIKLQDEQMR